MSEGFKNKAKLIITIPKRCEDCNFFYCNELGDGLCSLFGKDLEDTEDYEYLKCSECLNGREVVVEHLEAKDETI